MDLEVRAAEFLHDLTAHTARAARLVLSLHRLPGRTADHGCDPAYTRTTDHTREYVPLLMAGKHLRPVNLGTRKSFADIAATVTELLGVPYQTPGTSFATEIL